MTETYNYRADGQLSGTSVVSQMGVANSYAISAGAMGSAWTGSAYSRDDLGRVLGYVEYKPEGGSAYGTSSTYNSRNELVSQTVTITGESSSQTSTTTYDYRAETTPGVYTGAYMGGAVVHSRTTGSVNGVARPTSDTKNVYEWWDATRVQSTVHDPDIAQSGATNSSGYYYDDAGHLASVYIQDGQPRTVSFITNAEGLVLQRQERDSVSYTTNPLDLHYYFNGVRIGDVTNVGVVRADFDQNADDPGGRGHDAAAARHTVQAGDTLAGVAEALWGDASLWWKLAEANGLSGGETLIAGQSLVVPPGVVRTGNGASTFRPYDPGKAQGDLAPIKPRPQAATPRNNGCGAFGQILLVVVAVAVTAILAPPLVGNAATATAGATGLTATLGATGATIVGGALAGAAGSIASQAFGVATGIQDKFSWKGVALAAIAGGVGGALGASNVFGKISSSPFVQGAVRGAAGNALTQGLAVATGLQSKFDWAGVAVGAAVGGVVGGLSKTLKVDYGAGFDPANMALQAGAGMAGAIAGGAARSLLTGTSFGDNVLAALPDVVGSTIGNAVAGQFASSGATHGNVVASGSGGGGGKAGWGYGGGNRFSAYQHIDSRFGQSYGLSSPAEYGMVANLADGWSWAEAWGSFKSGIGDAINGIATWIDNSGNGDGHTTGADIVVMGRRVADNLDTQAMNLASRVSTAIDRGMSVYSRGALAAVEGQRLQTEAPFRPILQSKTPLGILVQANTTGNLPPVLLPQAQRNMDVLQSASIADIAVTALPLKGVRFSRATPIVSKGLINGAHVAELTANGVKFTPDALLATGRNSAGQVVFLESGNARAGLQHIVGEHGTDFARIGVSEAEIPSVVMRAVTEGKIIGYQGRDQGRGIYEILLHQQNQRIAVTVGNNGYIVGANPAGRVP
jgi:hypothetical protein